MSAYRAPERPTEPIRSAVARVTWVEPNGQEHVVIRHVSSLGPLRAKLDWIAYHYHPRWWPRVTVDYWHSMHDLLDGVVHDASETLMFPARFFHS